MALFRNLQRRALVIDGNRTGIDLEPQFWIVADKISKAQGISWQVRASDKSTKAPRGRASGLRLSILESFNGQTQEK